MLSLFFAFFPVYIWGGGGNGVNTVWGQLYEVLSLNKGESQRTQNREMFADLKNPRNFYKLISIYSINKYHLAKWVRGLKMLKCSILILSLLLNYYC